MVNVSRVFLGICGGFVGFWIAIRLNYYTIELN